MKYDWIRWTSWIVRCRTIWYDEIHKCIRYNTMRYDEFMFFKFCIRTMRYDTIQCYTMKYDVLWYYTITCYSDWFVFVFFGQFKVHLRHVFPGRIMYGGTSILKTIRKRFDDLKIKDWIVGTPCGQFLTEAELNFSLVLIHTLLQCKIEATTWGEIQFGLGGKWVRFGRPKYSLICGLSYEGGPSKNEQD